MPKRITEKSLTFEEKKNQTEHLIPTLSMNGKINPLEIFNPQGEKISVKGREYILYPLPLKKMVVLNRISKEFADINEKPDNMEETLKNIAKLLADILNAPKDEEFIYENFTQATIEYIFLHIVNLSQGLTSKKA